MIMSPAHTGNVRTHAFLDDQGHGCWPYYDGPSIALPQMTYHLLEILADFPFDTLIPYDVLYARMWPNEIGTSYRATQKNRLQFHLDQLRFDMLLYGGWHRATIRTVYGLGIRVNSHHFPDKYRINSFLSVF